MTIHTAPRAQSRASVQTRPAPPEPVLAADPDTMHPRAVAMAEAMRGGAVTFRALVGEGFTTAEIVEFKDEARALATTLSTRQVAPGADLMSELVEKARAAIHHRLPQPAGASECQASVTAWHRYCLAKNAHVLDPWPGQRERCLSLLEAYFRTTPAGPNVTAYVVRAVAETLEARH